MHVWFKGLLAAMLSGAAMTAGTMVVDPDHFSTLHLRHLALVACGGALIGVLGYLKQSPLPGETS